MKYHLIFLLLFVGIFQACEDLDENTTGEIAAESFYADDISLKAGIIGIHRQFSTIWFRTLWSVPTTGDDILTARPASSRQKFREYDQFEAKGGLPELNNEVWEPPYIAIRAANSFIQNIEGNIDQIDVNPTLINQRLGEARYMRALSYFALTRIFGDIPYFETAAMQDSSTRSLDKRVVYDRIINDLEYAEQYCVGDKEAAGQVTKWAAKAGLAQVYMQLTGWPFHESDKWTEVKQYCEEIINSGKFELMPYYGDLFKYTKYNENKEDIMTLTYGIPDTDAWQRFYGKPWESWDDMHCQWRFYYEFPEGERKSFSLQATMELTPYKKFTHPAFSKFLFGTIKFDPQGINDQEYIDSYEHTWKTSNNIALERLANIYLMWAEADANISSNISLQALEHLNKVKRRAYGDGNNLGGDFYHSAIQGVDVSASDFTSVEGFIEAIVDERAYEFAGEYGYRWFDLVRLEKIAEVTAQRNNYSLDDAIQVSLDDWDSKNPSASQEKRDAQIETLKSQATEVPLTDENPTVEKYGFSPYPHLVLQSTPGMKEAPLTSYEK